MAKSETTGRTTASAVGEILSSKTSTKSEKSVAASALAQTKGKNVVTKSVASMAAKILRDPKASRAAKTAAASALTQWPAKIPRNAASIRNAVTKVLGQKG